MSPGTPGRERSVWGWGWADAGPGPEYERGIAHALAARYGLQPLSQATPPALESLTLPASRCDPPASLAPLCSTEPRDRAAHTYGRSFRDVVRGLRGDFPNPPDLVAFPRTEARRRRRCSTGARASAPPRSRTAAARASSAASSRRRATCIPRCVSLDLGRLDRVLEVDRTSRAARIQAGVLGPALEEQLRPHGLTLRHFPQSFEFSTLGGWIATRSGGHYATLYTHIDDFVESLRVVTPSGVVADAPPARLRRRPGARPPLHRLRGHPRRHHRGVDAPAGPPDVPRVRHRHLRRVLARGAAAARAIAQAGLYPANCRLLDAGEAAVSGAGDRRRQPCSSWRSSRPTMRSTPGWRARSSAPAITAAACRQTRAQTRSTDEGAREGAAGAWRQRVPRRAVSPRRARRPRA